MSSLQPALGFASGVLIGLAIIMPVFGATSSAFDPWAGIVTLVAAPLLVLGFALHAARTARESKALRARVVSPPDSFA